MSNDAARIGEITKELNGILEARLAELGAAMKGAEAATRQILSAELEISRHKQLVESLTGEAGELKREMTAMRARADEVRSAHGGLLAEREKLRADVIRLEVEAREGTGETDRLRARARTLEAEVDGAKKENDGLKGRIKTLEDNVAKLQKLREELKAQMAVLSAGAKE